MSWDYVCNLKTWGEYFSDNKKLFTPQHRFCDCKLPPSTPSEAIVLHKHHILHHPHSFSVERSSSMSGLWVWSSLSDMSLPVSAPRVACVQPTVKMSCHLQFVLLHGISYVLTLPAVCACACTVPLIFIKVRAVLNFLTVVHKHMLCLYPCCVCLLKYNCARRCRWPRHVWLELCC